MKLILCTSCQDIVRLLIGETRKCHCGCSWGKYMEKTSGRAEIGGDAIPIAMDSNLLGHACWQWRKDNRTSFIPCWTIDPTQEANEVKITDGAKE